ncbi:hypothetical protein IP92_04873 [Pseudoduganella flava]|uniref:Uncharacterized protein n=1 Tax=Pseudoduganella flava TaxID=871742 RepID=A0A562PHB8_9BURK|nr:hypothetical protein [Pseudoduganella flava]QGZ42659.1 hypothetical protein GO485_28905 [Pseudoduganella flava]TWI43819.1 hypothetical protein IP92_04873 [Pseudoduganella flava]
MLLSDFRARTSRAIHWPSSRLRLLIGAIESFHLAPSEQMLDAVGRCLNAWQMQDPREYAERGQPIRQELDIALLAARSLCPGLGLIAIVDPSAHPPYEPNAWNTHNVRVKTNCYAYACNDRYDKEGNDELPHPGLLLAQYYPAEFVSYMATGHAEYEKVARKPQPAGGFAAPARTVEADVRFRVMLDDMARGKMNMAGLKSCIGSEQPGYQPANIPGHYLAALFIAENDYHWYRQDNTGYWSHKPGQGEATNLDVAGRLIRDPRVRPLPGYRLSGFYHVPKGGVRTATYPRPAPAAPGAAPAAAEHSGPAAAGAAQAPSQNASGSAPASGAAGSAGPVSSSGGAQRGSPRSGSGAA